MIQVTLNVPCLGGWSSFPQNVNPIDLYTLYFFFHNVFVLSFICLCPSSPQNAQHYVLLWRKRINMHIKIRRIWVSKRKQWQGQKCSIIWTSSKMQAGSVSHPASSLWLSFSIRSATSLWLHLLKATSLFSVYISTAAMVQDMDAKGA